MTAQATLKRYSFYIAPAQAQGLKAVKQRDGIPEGEQIRRAINDWLEKKGIKKSERPHVTPRERS